MIVMPQIRAAGDDLSFLHERFPLTTEPVIDTTRTTKYEGPLFETVCKMRCEQ